MGELSGRAALVTGASKGIGAAIALALGAAGADVVVNYATDHDGAREVVAGIEATGARAIAVQADVTDPVAVQRLLDTTLEAFGGLHVLVNNAGLSTVFHPFAQLPSDELRRVLEANLLGPFLVTQEALPRLAAGASVINVSSKMSESPLPGSTAYSASKSALNAMTAVAAIELAVQGIRVNAILPGPVETEGTQRLGTITDESRPMIAAMTPLGRVGQPADIAPLAVFLASDASGWLTGQAIAAAGGLR